MIFEKHYGTTKLGENVKAFTLENNNGMQATILEYGCIIESFIVTCPNATQRGIVLGFDNLAQYESDTSSQGAFVGRYANRIEGASFDLCGNTYALSKNNGENHLHGVFSKKLFEGSIDDDKLVLRAVSPDMEDGFPGELSLCVTYCLTDDKELILEYKATSSKSTIINLTNHSYFNLDGESSESVLTQSIWLNCKQFTQANEQTCTTGKILDCANTPMDFTCVKEIGRDINADYNQLTMAKGYDHNFIIDKPLGQLALAAMAKSTDNRIIMQAYTTQPGLQLYTANYLNTICRGNNKKDAHSAFCLETQHYPCTPSHSEFPSVELHEGEEYHELTIYKIITAC